MRISGPRQTREYGYSATGRLESVRTLAPDPDIRIPYATDPAGNRLPDPSYTRTARSRRGRITASQRMRTMFTTMMNTAD
nr:hypothetical protein [Escherichia coli]